MDTISKYASLVKFSHTIFAMPFALVGYVYALVHTQTPFNWLLLAKILLCMVLARNTAMGFNRWADRRIDAENPRTAGREIPSGRVSVRSALIFTIVNATGFVAAAWSINTLALALSPVALIIIMGYSFTKRFTAWSHIVLGTSLAIAPVGAYIAVTGSVAIVPVLLAGLVVSWVGGFDILYSLQDMEHDRKHNLHSIPARFSASGAVWISILLHCVTVYTVWLIGIYREFSGGYCYWTGAALFVGLLALQHIIFRPSKVNLISKTFGTMNGISSITFAVFAIMDLLLK